jgi:hypothetical protein
MPAGRPGRGEEICVPTSRALSPDSANQRIVTAA